MMKLKKYEVRWHNGFCQDLIMAFGVIGSDSALFEQRWNADEEVFEYPDDLSDEVARFKQPAGSIRSWLKEQDMAPWYNGPGDLWMCLLDEDQAVAFRMRWL